MEKQKFINIYEYSDFRAFLSDYQAARQKCDPAFNRSKVCKKLGLPNSRSFFNDVVKGRVISPTFVDRFIDVCELDKDEALFFRALVKFNQAADSEERELYLDQLLSLNKTPRVILDAQAYTFYRQWRHNVIRTTLDIIDFKNNYRELVGCIKPRITVKEARESIHLLQSLGLIDFDSRGFLKPTQKDISTGPYVKHEIVKHFQQHCFNIGASQIFAKDSAFRNFSTNTISLSAEALEKVKKEIGHFKSRIRAIVQSDHQTADRTYQLNIQCFPLSKAKKKE